MQVFQLWDTLAEQDSEWVVQGLQHHVTMSWPISEFKAGFTQSSELVMRLMNTMCSIHGKKQVVDTISYLILIRM